MRPWKWSGTHARLAGRKQKNPQHICELSSKKCKFKFGFRFWNFLATFYKGSLTEISLRQLNILVKIITINKKPWLCIQFDSKQLWSGQMSSEEIRAVNSKVDAWWYCLSMQVLQEVCGFSKCLMFCVMNCGWSLRDRFRSRQHATHLGGGLVARHAGSPPPVCLL